MQMISRRLSEISRQIPDEIKKVADIGCDHGQLALYLSKMRGIEVIAGDISRSSLDKARRLVSENPDAHVKLRVGDGLTILDPGEVDAVVLAGLGGQTIIDILSADPQRTRSFSRIIFQPMNGRRRLREWLMEAGYCVIDEGYACENRRCYSIFSVRTGDQSREGYDVVIGDWKLGAQHPLFDKWIDYQLGRRIKVASAAGKDSKRMFTIQQEIKKIEECAQWLQQWRT